MDGYECHRMEDEDDLMALVAEALTEVPAWVATVGRGVYTWRDVDAELAALQALAMPRDGD